MNLDGTHVKYQELSKDDVIKKGDTTSFAQVSSEINRIYEWEKEFYEAVDYRSQLPEETQKNILNEFLTVMTILQNIVRLRNDDVGALAQQKQDLINNIKRLYGTLYSLFAQDYRGWRFEAQGDNLIKELEDKAAQAEQKIEKKAEQESDQAVTKIIGAETTEQWSREYSQYIDADKQIESRLRLTKRRKEQAKERNKGKTRFILNFWQNLKSWAICLYISKIQGVAFYGGHSYLNISSRWRFWRSIFYFALFTIAMVYLVYFLSLESLEGNKLLNFFLEKLAFLPLVLVIALGLTFASKNYKINSNLLEEYKHRYVVAKTIQNLLLLPAIKKNTNLQTQLLTGGTSILFEHRVSGYMGRDSEEKLLESLISSQLDSIKGKK